MVHSKHWFIPGFGESNLDLLQHKHERERSKIDAHILIIDVLTVITRNILYM